MLLCFAAFLAAVLACLLTSHSILFAILLGMVLFCGLGLRRGFSLRELGSMLSSTLLIFSTCLYAGVLEGIRALAPIERQVERLSGGIGRFPAAMVLSLGIDAVFCNQGVTILMDEQLLAESYRRDGASRQELAMDIENSGVVMAALIPWSVALSVPMAMLEINPLKGLPWCVLLYLLPLCYLVTKRWFYPQKERCHTV